MLLAVAVPGDNCFAQVHFAAYLECIHLVDDGAVRPDSSGDDSMTTILGDGGCDCVVDVLDALLSRAYRNWADIASRAV